MSAASSIEKIEAHGVSTEAPATQAHDGDIQMIVEVQMTGENKGESKDEGESKGERDVWRAASWAEQCSKHLVHVEKRLMEAEFMGHEVVRQMMTLMATSSPHGDWGWLMRNCQDIAVRTMRQLRRLWQSPWNPKYGNKFAKSRL